MQTSRDERKGTLRLGLLREPCERRPVREQGGGQHPVAHELTRRLLSRSDVGVEGTLWKPEECGTSYQLEVQGYEDRMWAGVSISEEIRKPGIQRSPLRGKAHQTRAV